MVSNRTVENLAILNVYGFYAATCAAVTAAATIPLHRSFTLLWLPLVVMLGFLALPMLAPWLIDRSLLSEWSKTDSGRLVRWTLPVVPAFAAFFMIMLPVFAPLMDMPAEALVAMEVGLVIMTVVMVLWFRKDLDRTDAIWWARRFPVDVIDFQHALVDGMRQAGLAPTPVPEGAPEAPFEDSEGTIVAEFRFGPKGAFARVLVGPGDDRVRRIVEEAAGAAVKG